MSDIEVMRSIIYEQVMKEPYKVDAAKKAARALYDAGFRMSEGAVDAAQDARISELDRRLTRIEGWTGLPAYYDPPKAL